MEWIEVKEGKPETLPEDGFAPCESCSVDVVVWTNMMTYEDEITAGYTSHHGDVWHLRDREFKWGERVIFWMEIEPPITP